MTKTNNIISTISIDICYMARISILTYPTSFIYCKTAVGYLNGSKSTIKLIFANIVNINGKLFFITGSTFISGFNSDIITRLSFIIRRIIYFQLVTVNSES